MKKTVLILMILSLVPVSIAMAAYGEKKTATPPEAAATAGAVEVGNKICPVSGEKVGQMGAVVQIEYNGRIYNLCCKMCLKDFNKDPGKYSTIAEEEVKKTEEGKDHAEEGSSQEHGDHTH